MPESLREKASRKVRGPNANPSLLGDPISLKAEDSDNIPTDEERGAAHSPPSLPTVSWNGGGGETLREKAARKLKGPNANPSLLGDPISLKNETTPGVPTDSERGAKGEEVARRHSKL